MTDVQFFAPPTRRGREIRCLLIGQREGVSGEQLDMLSTLRAAAGDPQRDITTIWQIMKKMKLTYYLIKTEPKNLSLYFRK